MSDDAADREAAWLESAVGVCALEDRALVAVRGEDARAWLNGQLTNDVRQLDATRTVYGLILSTKGRILADATVHEHAGELVLDVPRAAWPAVAEHLEKYIIMEDVTLAEEPALALLTAQGPRVWELAGGEPASDRLRRGGRDRIVQATVLDAELERLAREATALGGGVVSSAGWELARLRAGVPRFGVDFGDDTYPHEAGLEKSAVSFQKGCYLGQEVVCMLESRGQISRRIARLEAHGPLEPGATLLDEAGAEVGRVSSVVRDADRRRALALVKRAALVVGTVLRAGGLEVRVLGPA